MEEYRKTSEKMAKQAFRDIEADLEAFITSRGLNNFGAGISGVGEDSRNLALKVLGFIYEQNSRLDFEMLVEGLNDEN